MFAESARTVCGYGAGVVASSSAQAVADGLALLAFVTVGLLSHDHALTATGYARDALPLLAGWYGAAALLGLYRRGGRRALLLTWAVGVPAGVVVRALVLGRSASGREAAFLVVALVFTGVFVLGFRAALALARRGRGETLRERPEQRRG